MILKIIFFFVFVINIPTKAQVANGLPKLITHVSLDSGVGAQILYPQSGIIKINGTSNTVNRFGKEGRAAERSYIYLDPSAADEIIDSCTISFWYKSDRGYETIIDINRANTFNLKVYTKFGKLYFERTENLDKKWSYGRVSINNIDISDNEWHQVTVRYANLTQLILNIDTVEAVQKLTLLSKRERLKLSNDNYGTTDGLYGFDTKNQFNISYPNAAMDDIVISATAFQTETIRDNYYAGGYQKRLKELLLAKEAEKKRLEDAKFTTRLKVLNYLSNKTFRNTLDNDNSTMSFDENAQNLYLSNATNLKIDGITILSEYVAHLAYYDYDPRLPVTIEVNSKTNSIRKTKSDWGGTIYTGLYKLEKEQMVSRSNIWTKKGVYKVEMKNPRTNNYDEIMMTNPGKFIEIKDDKDLRISDIDLFSLIFGKENLLFYNYAEFIDGKRQSTTIPQTVFYRGKIELKNNQGTNAKWGEAGVYFMQGAGKKLVEIANDICKCYCRLYYSDQVGMRIAN